MIYPLPVNHDKLNRKYSSAKALISVGSFCPVLVRAMLQHAFYNGIGTFAMMIYFLFIFY